jgi:hypothetical protein
MLSQSLDTVLFNLIAGSNVEDCVDFLVNETKGRSVEDDMSDAEKKKMDRRYAWLMAKKGAKIGAARELVGVAADRFASKLRKKPYWSDWKGDAKQVGKQAALYGAAFGVGGYALRRLKRRREQKSKKR